MSRSHARRGGQVQTEKPGPGDGTAPANDPALAELPPDSPEATGGPMSWAWRAALLVWAGTFGFLLLYELANFLLKVLR
jgi:hypothetical protein